MPYITDSQLNSQLDLPIALPMTELQAGDWTVLGTIKVADGQTLSFKLMQLHLLQALQNDVVVDINNACDPVTLDKIDPSLGLAYLSIFKDYSVSSNPLSQALVGTTADRLIITTVGIVVRDLTIAALELTAPGNYSFVLANNCSATDLRLSVNGQVRIKL